MKIGDRGSRPLWWARVGQALPTRDALTAHPWLRPVAGRLLDLQLWRLQHEAVARGVAVGIFWAFVAPVAQIIIAAAHCAWWRGNIPAAAAMTLLTNPFTIGFWLWLAFQFGDTVLGTPLAVLAIPGEDPSWLTEYALPTVLGMGVFAVGGAAMGYLAVKAIWRMRIWFKRRVRR